MVDVKTRLAWNELSTIRAKLDAYHAIVVPGDGAQAGEANQAMGNLEDNQ